MGKRPNGSGKLKIHHLCKNNFSFLFIINESSHNMTLGDIANMRLINQQIAGTKLKTPKDIVNWMGAMQAQDLGMAKWAIGVRLPGSTENIIEDALNKAEIIRTHLMRPTWHFVSPDDIYWMLELTAPQIKSSMSSRDRELGLTKSVYSKSNKIIEKVLLKQKQLKREDIKAELENANISTDNNRLSHLLFRAELEGIICSGEIYGSKQTYALLSERVPNKKVLTRQEALEALAKKYFTSHSPATVRDFSWWSGLNLTEAKAGLEKVKSEFISETINSETYWFNGSLQKSKFNNDSIYLLPAYDEYIISYRDRSASLPLQQHKTTISSNGMFWPVVVINGHVSGTWKRTIKKENVIVDFSLFYSLNKKQKIIVEESANKFGNFLGKKAELNFKMA